MQPLGRSLGAMVLGRVVALMNCQRVPMMLAFYALCVDAGAYGQSAAAIPDTGTVTKGHLWLSAPAATLFAFGGAVVGILAGYSVFDCSDEGVTCGNGPDNAEGLGAAAGLFLGASFGAHLGGLRRDSRGNLGATMLAALAGSVAFAAAQLSYDGTGDDPASVVTFFATPLVAAAVNTQVRRPRGPRPQGATLGPSGRVQVFPFASRGRMGAAAQITF